MKPVLRRATLLVLLTAMAWARVGGGQSYSGGGSSHHSGGHGGDGEAIGFLIELILRLLFELLIHYPKIGIPLLLVLAFLYWNYTRQNASEAAFSQLREWSANNNVRGSGPANLEVLRNKDPRFSETLFLDFVNLLYTRARLLSGNDLNPIGAYLAADLRASLEGSSALSRVIPGAMRVVEVRVGENNHRVVVEIEANLDNLYVVEHLFLQRKNEVPTPAPEAVYRFACPNCGNSAPVDRQGRCSTCETVVNNGRFGWILTAIQRQHSANKPPLALGGGGVELGTDLPTRKSPEAGKVLAAIAQADPAFSWETMQKRIESTFLELQSAWTLGQWEKARPLESDALFGQHQLWMEAYAREGLRNVLEEVKVERIELARAQRDSYFDTLTVRIFATMKDFTIRLSDQALVEGDRKTSRRFSEYWTFVRRTGVTSKAREEKTCPNCAAPLDRVNQAGVCEYCDAAITRGDFDWVLSRIEQDESYFA